MLICVAHSKVNNCITNIMVEIKHKCIIKEFPVLKMYKIHSLYILSI